MFLEALYDSFSGVQNRYPDLALPDLGHVNMILARTDAGFQIDPPNLVSTRAYHSVQVVAVPPTLEEQARDLIERSLSQSQSFLDSGQYKQSVAEIIWLLESIVTAFRGVEIDTVTVQGKYFNVIAKELRASSSGSTLDRALGWLSEVHGYLSSPTGGGLRHGMDLNKGRSIGASEARLYCNLMRLLAVSSCIVSSDIGSLTIQQRRISTRIQVEDGQLIILGGLLHSSRSLGDTGIPYLSRIPELGAAFRTRDDNRRQTELVMFLRPTVVRARKDVDALGREMVARLSALGLPVERVAP